MWAQSPEDPPPRHRRPLRGVSLSPGNLPQQCLWIHVDRLPTAQHKSSALIKCCLLFRVSFWFKVCTGKDRDLTSVLFISLSLCIPSIKSYNNSQDAFWAWRRRSVPGLGESFPPCPGHPLQSRDRRQAGHGNPQSWQGPLQQSRSLPDSCFTCKV